MARACLLCRWCKPAFLGSVTSSVVQQRRYLDLLRQLPRDKAVHHNVAMLPELLNLVQEARHSMSAS